VLFACSAGVSDKQAPLVNGKYRSPHCFKNIKRLPTMKLVKFLDEDENI
jgi:hypothetical protein